MALSLDEIKKALSSVEAELLCHICDGKPKPGKPRWYRCIDHLHQICQDCKESTVPRRIARIRAGIRADIGASHCKCGSRIPDENCKVTEAFLKAMPPMRRCEMSTHGCEFNVCGEEAMALHQADCEYRMVPCPYVFNGKCEDLVEFRKVIQHFDEKHESEKFPLELIDQSKKFTLYPKLLVAKNFCFPNVRMERYGQTFLTSGIRRGDLFYHWVHCLGSSEVTKNFEYVLEFEGPYGTARFVGEPFPIDKSWHAIVKSKKCFAYGFEALKVQFVDEDLKIEFSLKIRKGKKEAEDDAKETKTEE